MHLITLLLEFMLNVAGVLGAKSQYAAASQIRFENEIGRGVNAIVQSVFVPLTLASYCQA